MNLDRGWIDSRSTVADGDLEEPAPDTAHSHRRWTDIAKPESEAEAARPPRPRRIEHDVVQPRCRQDDPGDESVTPLLPLITFGLA